MSSPESDEVSRTSRLACRSKARVVAFGLVVALGLSASSTAYADLQRDVELVARRWRSDGHHVTHVASAFLLAGTSKTIRLPDTSRAARPCTTVVALSVRGIPFVLEWVKSPEPSSEPTGEGAPEATGEAARNGGARSTAAGVATLSSCARSTDSSETDPRPDAVAVTFGSSRGAVELVAVEHRGEVSPLEGVLPERSAGQGVRFEAPTPLSLAPLDERLRRGIRVARFDGAVEVVTAESESDSHGRGAVVLRLSEGCHRLGVLSDAGNGGAADVDVELRVEDTVEPHRKDNSHAPDARVELCLGGRAPVELRWRGARPERPVAIVDARWAFPALPQSWPAPMRVGVAGALWRRRTKAPSAPPLGSWIATSGRTILPVAVEPGSCYLAVAAERSGDPSGLRLRVESGDDRYQDDGSEDPLGAAVKFCAGGATRVRAVLDVRGAQSSVGLALFHMVGRPR